MTKPKFLIPSAITAFAVLAVLAVSLFASMRPVSAAELTQQTLTKVSQLTPDALHALDLKVNGDPKAELEAAKNAKDLQVLTYDQLQKLDASNNGGLQTVRTGPAGVGNDGPSTMDSQNLKYLRYTDNDGTIHTIGVGKDGLPVIIMTFRDNGNGSSQGSVEATGGKAGQMITGGFSSATAIPAGAVSCSPGADGKTVCTSGDGTAAPMPNCTSSSNGMMTCSASAATVVPKQ